MSTRTRAYCFTSFKEEEPIYDKDKIKYMIYQKECCPSTKKEHWQGYVEFFNIESIKTAKRIFDDDKIHLEVRRGTQEQAIDYCKKSESSIEGTRKEYGKKAQQGSRSDLDGMVDMIDSGATSWEILKEYRGNALRHMGMIRMGLEAKWSKCNIDNHIIEFRQEMLKNGMDIETLTDIIRKDK